MRATLGADDIAAGGLLVDVIEAGLAQVLNPQGVRVNVQKVIKGARLRVQLAQV